MSHDPSMQTEPLLNNSPQSYYTGVVERLRNPLWSHSASSFGSPQLNQETTIADMDEAATIISELQATLAASCDEARSDKVQCPLASRIRSETVERIKETIVPWTSPATARQRAGEMTAQEVRTVQAILSSILDAIRSLSTDDAVKTAESEHSPSPREG